MLRFWWPLRADHSAFVQPDKSRCTNTGLLTVSTLALGRQVTNRSSGQMKVWPEPHDHRSIVWGPHRKTQAWWSHRSPFWVTVLPGHYGRQKYPTEPSKSMRVKIKKAIKSARFLLQLTGMCPYRSCYSWSHLPSGPFRLSVVPTISSPPFKSVSSHLKSLGKFLTTNKN